MGVDTATEISDRHEITNIRFRPGVHSERGGSEKTGAFEVQLIETMTFGRTFAVDYETNQRELRKGYEKDTSDNTSGNDEVEATEAVKESIQA